VTVGWFDEHPRGVTSRTRLIRLGFADTDAAENALSELGLWAAGGPADEDAAVVVLALGEAVEPDLAVAALERLANALADPAPLLAALRESDGLRRRLLGVLGASIALGDHLAAHPHDWVVLLDDDATLVRPSRLGLQWQLLDAVGADHTAPTGTTGSRAKGAGPEVVAALRAAYRRCLLALAARDLSGEVAVEDVAGELADLAAAALTAGLAVALAGLPENAPGCRLAVIGMGKAGGRELNYVSDVDVVFVAEPLEGVSDDDALRTATTLASSMMRVCADVAWPVDAALRPEGKAGPLVRTLASHEAYYRRWAGTWEFQALLKARPIAGDLVLGAAYVDALAPLVWAVGDRPSVVEDLLAMRRRGES
jgi:glutamate-ammonia-ligase adenylyltransferase